MSIKKRSRQYFFTKKMVQLVNQYDGCIEFPHFGARYPDACCIEGFLWDLDSGDYEGLSSGGDDVCPKCYTVAYVREMTDNGVSLSGIKAHLQFIFSKYGVRKRHKQ